ncbi:MAG: pilus assembly protein TadG-related protein, partial [Anaerolineae bacterium]
MKKVKDFFHLQKQESTSEKGQSIVIIAFLMVGLLAFVGLAVDVGLIFARSTQLQAAVDAAALAAVTELTGVPQGVTTPADIKAAQFLAANNLPTSVITPSLPGVRSVSALNATQYAITVTWPVDLFFLQLINRDAANVTKSATAAYFPLADIYASRRVESGALSTSNQSVFGPDICINYGDPYSPSTSPWHPGFYSYQYRILIPSGYPSDVLRVELFDPDSMNGSSNSANVTFSSTAIQYGGFSLTPQNMSCSSNNRRNPCLIKTGELSIVNPTGNPPITIDNVNPFWFMRIDENRGTNTPGNCGQPSSYDTAYNTATVYQLYYYVQNPDGTISRVDLAKYTGQTGDGVRDNGNHQTDMQWVSPGGSMIYDQLANVPVDAGSLTDFELSIANDLVGILSDPGTGNRYVYLDVTAVSGGTENGFEIWAGPDYTGSVSANVNTRNIQVINNPASHNSKGVTIYGMGNLPMNSNFNNAVDIPLIWVGPEMAGQDVFVSLYDSDSFADAPIVFYFDSIAFSP